MIAFFANIFGYVLNFIYNIVQNYGIAIIIFSVLIKLLLLPTTIKQQKTMKKTQKIQAKMKEIQFKFKNDPERLNKETMELYRSEKMSPFSGCFSAIIQLILLFAVFYLVRSPLTYMKKVDSEVINKYYGIMQDSELATKSNYPEIQILRELENIRQLPNKINDDEENKVQEKNEEEKIENSVNEQNAQNAENEQNSEEETEKKVVDINEIIEKIDEEELNSMKINMKFLGLDLAQIPTQSGGGWQVYIIPVLYVITSIISMKITTNAQQKTVKTEENGDKKEGQEEFDPMVQMNKNMTLMFPIMYVLVALVAPLGLALYWLVNSLLMIIERLSLNVIFKNEEE